MVAGGRRALSARACTCGMMMECLRRASAMSRMTSPRSKIFPGAAAYAVLLGQKCDFQNAAISGASNIISRSQHGAPFLAGRMRAEDQGVLRMRAVAKMLAGTCVCWKCSCQCQSSSAAFLCHCLLHGCLPAHGLLQQVRLLVDLSLDSIWVDRIAREDTVWCRQPGGAQGAPAASSTGDFKEKAASSAAAAAGGSVSYQKAVPFQYPEQPAKQAPRPAVPKMAPLPPPPGKASFAPCNTCASV